MNEKKKKLLNQKRDRKRKIIKLEEEISIKEDELESIDNILSKPENYDDLNTIVDLTKKREEIEMVLNDLYEKWIILNEE